MQFKLKIFCGIVFLLFNFSFLKQLFADYDPEAAGTYHPRVIPPAPTVGTLGKYGDVPVNLATGAPNINIPLYTLRYKNAQLPISLSYSSNGVKVSDVASWVGMSWVLNAGGVVCRTIRGGADENSTLPLPENIDQYNPGTVTFIKYQWDHTTDTEPDIFNYNFDGNTGKFVVDLQHNMKVYSIPYNNLKIEINYDTTTAIGIYSILITTPSGVKYLFGENYYDTTNPNRTTSCNFRNYKRSEKTAWHLKKIEYPTGEILLFKYRSKTVSYYSGASQTIRKFTYTNFPDDDACSDIDNEDYCCAQRITHNTWHLDSIIAPDNQCIVFRSHTGRADINDLKLDTIKIFNSKMNIIKEVIFSYSFPGHMGYLPYFPEIDDTSVCYRMFLDSLKIKGTNNINPQHYSFNYYNVNQLPSRLSFDQDHWGYFNNQNNRDFVVVPDYLQSNPQFEDIICNRDPQYGIAQAGILNRIIYPTGGYDTLEYEPNTYSSHEYVYPPPQIVETSVYGVGCIGLNPRYDSIDYTIPFNQSDTVSSWMMFTEDSCEYVKTRHYGYIKILDVTNSPPTTVLSKTWVRRYYPITKEINYLEGHTYRAILTAYGNGTEIYFGAEYYTEHPSWQWVERITGGMRIKRVTAIDNLTSKREITRYYYGNLEDINKSSGITAFNPIYCNGQTIKKSRNGFIDECHFIVFYSNSINDLFNVGGGNIMYLSVIKSFGEEFENGGELYEFLVDEYSIDDPGDPVSWSTDGILGATLNNRSWNNGVLLHQNSFKKNENSFIPLKDTRFVYNDDARRDTTFHGFVFRKNYNEILTYPYIYVCTEEDMQFSLIACNAEHRHHLILLPGMSICNAPGNNNINIHINPCEYTGDSLVNYTCLDNYSGIKYDIYCKWNHLDTVITKTYDTTGQNYVTETTIYKFDNPEHALVTSTSMMDSKGDTVKNCLYYPQDYSESAIASNFPELVNNHIINVVIDERELIDGKIKSGKTTRYNEFGQPLEINLAREELGTVLQFDPDAPYSYGTKEAELQYLASTNNVKNYLPVNNLPVCYLWAYKNVYPVIEVTGADFDQVNTVLQQGNFSTQTLGESMDNNYITSAASYLRGHLTSARVISYTYEPQIGMISKTDAVGIKNTFEYDSSGRLALIKDHNGNIIKKYDYHYASQ